MHLELAFVCLSSSISILFHSQWYLAISCQFIIPIILKSPSLLPLQLLCGHPLFLVPFNFNRWNFFDLLWFCTFFSLYMLIIYYTCNAFRQRLKCVRTHCGASTNWDLILILYHTLNVDSFKLFLFFTFYFLLFLFFIILFLLFLFFNFYAFIF